MSPFYFRCITCILALAPLVGAVRAQTPTRGKGNTVVKLSGGLNAYAGMYVASGIAGRNQPTPFGLSGAVTVTLPGGISLPFSAVLGNQGVSFRQPFNLVGVSPNYKWVTLHAGYRNVTFSPFTLAGHTFLGGGFELTPGKFRVGAVYGRFNQAISSTLADPGVLPAFRRVGYAVKLGYGTRANFVDLVLLRAADDSASIAPVPAALAQTVNPAENLVVGLVSRLLVAKHFTVEMDAASSAFTRDVRATAVNGQAASGLVRGVGRLFGFTPRLSTQLTNAVQAAVGYQAKWGSLKLQYKRIDPNFQTMGAYYFQSDLESYTLAPSVTLLGSKLRLAGSYGVQYDNLGGNKNARTGRNIGSLTVSYNPGPVWGVDAVVSNYGISQQAGFRPLIDTIRLAQNNFSATLNTRYTRLVGERAHVFSLTATHQQLSDLNATTASQTNNDNQNVNLGYFYQDSKTGLGLNGMLSYTQTNLPEVSGRATVRFFGPTLGGNYAFLEKKLTTSLNVSYLVNQQLGVTGRVLTATTSLGYQVGKRQTMSLSANYLNSSTGQQNETFNEFRANIGYGISF